jgi:hypothetical protein
MRSARGAITCISNASWFQFPVVLATGYADSREVKRFETDPRFVTIGKPFEPEQLKNALLRVGVKLPAQQ